MIVEKGRIVGSRVQIPFRPPPYWLALFQTSILYKHKQFEVHLLFYMSGLQWPKDSNLRLDRNPVGYKFETRSSRFTKNRKNVAIAKH
ncbi:hypothetical protein TNCV_1667341 [Trichonephila clavipes]|nr:hypothetical protein TNCV_1667341 [Trichonephila clavipes]